MRATIMYQAGDVRIENIPDATIKQPTDAVIRVIRACICGSDLSYIKYGGIMREPGGVTPIGHEGAGEVLSVGPDVSGVSVGDPVIINPMMTPSNIGSGGPEGAFVDELLVRDAERGTNLLPIPEGVPYDVAAMCEPLAVAMHGVNRMEVKPGDKVSAGDTLFIMEVMKMEVPHEASADGKVKAVHIEEGQEGLDADFVAVEIE